MAEEILPLLPGVANVPASSGAAFRCATYFYQLFSQVDLNSYPEQIREKISTSLSIILNFLKNIDRKKWLSRAEFLRDVYSVIPAALSIYSCTTNGGLNASLGLFVTLLLTPVWNGTDIVCALLSAPDYIEAAKKNATASAKFIAASNIIYYPFILGAATLAATISSVSDAANKCNTLSSKQCFNQVLWQSDETLGDPNLLALSDAAYGVGALLMAVYALLSYASATSRFQTQATVSANVNCFIGAAMGACSMLWSPKEFVNLSAAFYALYSFITVAHLFSKSKLASACSSRFFSSKSGNDCSDVVPELSHSIN